MPLHQDLEADLRREDIEDIFSAPPTAAIRKVLLSITVAITLLGVVFWFIKVPGEAPARIVIIKPVSQGDSRGYATFRQDQYPFVKTGDSIRVEFSCFPLQEYGTVTGYIRQAAHSFDPNGLTFTSEIAFPVPVISSKGKTLALLPDMSGTGMIRASGERMFYIFLGRAGH
jgi:hypothetical protein